jgi:hypothetical protein
MSTVSLYRRVLGPRFDALPDVLRRFHDAPDGNRARGTFWVKRGQGWVRNALASILGMPGPGEDLLVTLEVAVEGQRERWTRHFPDRRLVSVQWADDGLLIERFGAVSLSSRLDLVASLLRYEFVEARIAGIRLPSWLTPQVEGTVLAVEGSWHVVVRVTAPIVGLIVHYEGMVEPA